MYGTVGRFQLKPGKRDEYLKMMQASTSDRPPGALNLISLKSDSDPDVLWMAVAFESKETYRANANSPQMNERYKEMQEYFAAEPEWHDGEAVVPWA